MQDWITVKTQYGTVYALVRSSGAVCFSTSAAGDYDNVLRVKGIPHSINEDLEAPDASGVRHWQSYPGIKRKDRQFALNDSPTAHCSALIREELQRHAVHLDQPRRRLEAALVREAQKLSEVQRELHKLEAQQSELLTVQAAHYAAQAELSEQLERSPALY